MCYIGTPCCLEMHTSVKRFTPGAGGWSNMEAQNSASIPTPEKIPVAVLPSLVRLNTSDTVITFCSSNPSAIVNPTGDMRLAPVAAPSRILVATAARGRGRGAGHGTKHSASAADHSNDASMHHMHQSMPSYTPIDALSQSLGVAAAEAHLADGGVCPVVLAPIIAEYIIGEFGNPSSNFPEAFAGISGMHPVTHYVLQSTSSDALKIVAYRVLAKYWKFMPGFLGLLAAIVGSICTSSMWTALQYIDPVRYYDSKCRCFTQQVRSGRMYSERDDNVSFNPRGSHILCCSPE